jgi:hypothetical protein
LGVVGVDEDEVQRLVGVVPGAIPRLLGVHVADGVTHRGDVLFERGALVERRHAGRVDFR